MESQDIGNHHFGAVALDFGLFPSKTFILKQAGAYKIKSGTSKLEWQIYKEVKKANFTKGGTLHYSTEKILQAPYGDDPRDQNLLNKILDIMKTNKP